MAEVRHRSKNRKQMKKKGWSNVEKQSEGRERAEYWERIGSDERKVVEIFLAMAI